MTYPIDSKSITFLFDDSNPRVEVVVVTALRDILRAIPRLDLLPVSNDLDIGDLGILSRERHRSNCCTNSRIKLGMVRTNIERDSGIL